MRTSARLHTGQRIHRTTCESPFCRQRVAAIAVFVNRLHPHLRIRFEMCTDHTTLEIVRHADGCWSGSIISVPAHVVQRLASHNG